MGLKFCLFLVYVLIILKACGVLTGLILLVLTPIILPFVIRLLIEFTGSLLDVNLISKLLLQLILKPWTK